MKLLDQLEQQALQKQQREETLAIEARERSAHYHQVTEPAMQQLLDYLKQLTSHLNYLEHQREIEYQLPHYGKLFARTNPDFKTQFSSEESHSEIRLEASARIDRKRTPATEVRGSFAEQLSQLLVEYGLHANKESERNPRGEILSAEFQVYGTINISVSIRADVDSRDIGLAFNNVDRLGVYRHKIASELIDENFLDDIGCFIARERDVLIREELAPELREKLRRGLQRENSQLGKLLGRES